MMTPKNKRIINIGAGIFGFGFLLCVIFFVPRLIRVVLPLSVVSLLIVGISIIAWAFYNQYNYRRNNDE